MEDPIKPNDKQGALVKSYTLCNLNELIRDVVEGLSTLEMTADLKLTTNIQVQHPIQVFGNEEQLGHLFSNLVMNAIQYTPTGSKITVTLAQENRHAVVAVQDTGIGIALKHQTRIFERFYRVNSDRARATGGAGLGLAIIQAHSGDLKIRSRVK